MALEFENALQVDGVDAVRIGRRSAIQWQLETSGKSGHSSQIFNETYGYGAVYEIARIIDQFRRELPEKGLSTFTSGGGRFPVASRSVSTADELPAPSTAVAVMMTGVPGGTKREAKRVNGRVKSVTALVNVVSKTTPTAPIA